MNGVRSAAVLADRSAWPALGLTAEEKSLPVSLRDVPEKDLLLRVNRAANRVSPQLRGLFIKAIIELKRSVDAGRLSVGIEFGAADMAVSAYEWGVFEKTVQEVVREPVTRVFEVGVSVGLDSLPAQFAEGLELEGIRLRREEWIGRHAAQLAREVTAETQRGVAAVIEGAFRRQAVPLPGSGTVARSVRDVLNVRQVSGYVGLTERQGRGLARRIVALASDPEVPAGRVQRLAERLHKRAVERRAQLIADTELANAGAAGRHASWQQGIAVQRIDPARFVAEWVALLVNTCERCEAMDGAQADLRGGVFVSRLGERATMPTLHPQCHCSTRLVRA